MAQKLNFGTLADESFIYKEITWKIPNVLSLPRSVDCEVRSPEFSFANGTWVLIMYPFGESKYGTESSIDFTAYRLESREAQQVVYFKIFIKTCRGKQFDAFRGVHSFTSINDKDGVGVNKFMKNSNLVAMKKTVAPGGTLTVVFQLRTKSTSAVEGTSQEKVVTSLKSLKKQLQTATPDKKLVLDFKKLLLSEDGSDVTLKVKGQKFKAHRTILRARSPVFASMLSHNMRENNTGLIDIVDCDPEHFPDFLSFLYCGSVESITSQNACSLYRAADKYDIKDLKSECLAFMKSHLNVDNFCDVIALALQHSEAGLTKQATDYFVKNALKIVMTVKWQVFMTENPTQSNELTIKALSAK